MFQDLGSDHLPILLTIPLSQVFCPNERLLSFNFQKACWDDFAYFFDCHCPSAEEYSSLSLSSAAALFTSLTLNAAKSSIPYASSVIAKAKTEAWQVTSSSLSPKSNPKSVYSLLCSVAGFSSSSPSFPNCSSSRESTLVFPNYLRSHFSVSQPKVLHSRARGYLYELR